MAQIGVAGVTEADHGGAADRVGHPRSYYMCDWPVAPDDDPTRFRGRLDDDSSGLHPHIVQYDDEHGYRWTVDLLTGDRDSVYTGIPGDPTASLQVITETTTAPREWMFEERNVADQRGRRPASAGRRALSDDAASAPAKVAPAYADAEGSARGNRAGDTVRRVAPGVWILLGQGQMKGEDRLRAVLLLSILCLAVIIGGCGPEPTATSTATPTATPTVAPTATATPAREAPDPREHPAYACASAEILALEGGEEVLALLNERKPFPSDWDLDLIDKWDAAIGDIIERCNAALEAGGG